MPTKQEATQMRTYQALPKSEEDFKKFIRDAAVQNLASRFGPRHEREKHIYRGARYAKPNDMHGATRNLILGLLPRSERVNIQRNALQEKQQAQGRDLKIAYERAQDQLWDHIRDKFAKEVEKAPLDQNQKDAFMGSSKPEDALEIIGSNSMALGAPPATLGAPGRLSKFGQIQRAQEEGRYESQLAAWNALAAKSNTLNDLQKSILKDWNEGKASLFLENPEFSYVDPQYANEISENPKILRQVAEKFVSDHRRVPLDHVRSHFLRRLLTKMEEGSNVFTPEEKALVHKDFSEMYPGDQVVQGSLTRQFAEHAARPLSLETIREAIKKTVPSDHQALFSSPESAEPVRKLLGLAKKPFQVQGMPTEPLSQTGQPSQANAVGTPSQMRPSAMPASSSPQTGQSLQSPQYAGDMPTPQGAFSADDGGDENVLGSSNQRQALARAGQQDVTQALQPYLEKSNRPLLESDAYQSYMHSPVMREMIEDMRKQSKDHFLKEIMPNINMSFAQRGAFHGTGRNEAIERASKRHEETFNRALMELLHKQHNEGLQSAQQQRHHQLESASQMARAAASEREGQMALSQAHNSQQAEHIKRTTAAAALLGAEAAQKQQNEQDQINAARSQHAEEEQQGPHALAQLTALTNNLPVPGPNVVSDAAVTRPQPTNYYSTTAGAIGNLMEGLRGREHHQARGGRSLNRAQGGTTARNQSQATAPNNELPIFNTPEMQELKAYQNNYQPHRHVEDPRWNYVRRVSANLLKDQHNPMAAIGRGMEEGSQDISSAEDSRRKEAIAIAHDIQTMRQRNHETMLEFQHKQEALAEQRRHNQGMEGIHGGQLAEQRRAHDMAEARSVREHEERKALFQHKQDAGAAKQRLATLKPTSADLDYEKKSEERARLLEDQLKNLGLMGETVGTTKSGKILERLPYVSQSPLLQSFVNLDAGNLSEYAKRHTATGNYARGEAKLTGGSRGGIGEINYAAANKWSPEQGQEALDTLVKREKPRTQKQLKEINFERDATNYGIPRLKAKALYPYWQEEQKANPKAKVSDFYRKAYAALAEGTFDLPELTSEQAEASWGIPDESHTNSPADQLSAIDAEIAQLENELRGGY